MQNNSRLVSIIITTYNRQNLILRAVRSAINQTYKNIEIIIVDDCSNDDTENLVLDFIKEFENIIYIRNEKRVGGNNSRNIGIKRAHGFFIAGLDDDDIFTENRIELLVKNYSSDFSLICTRSIIKTNTSEKMTKFSPNINLSKILHYNIVGNQALIEKDRIIEVGLYDESLSRYQDYDLWIRLIYQYGPAKMLKNITQIIDQTRSSVNHNSFQNKLQSSLYFYNKHKFLMNKNQRKTQLYFIRCLVNKIPQGIYLIKFLNRYTILNYIKQKI
jgi:glycosyltransferase involved in cell wall biosynthesis